MEIRSIEIKNFLSIGEAALRLDKRGVVLIEGDNRDSMAADSNGAGKSSIFEAIVWGLFGQTLRGLAADEVINNKKHRNCSVSLDISQGGSQYKVTRYRGDKRHSIDVVLESFENGEWKNLQGASSKETQNKINSLLSLEYTTFVNTLMFGQQMTHFFAASTDKEQKAVLESILGIEQYDKAQQLAKGKISEAKKNLAIAEMKVNHIKSDLVLKQTSLERYRQLRDDWDAESQKEIFSLHAKMGEIDKKISELPDTSEAKEAMELINTQLNNFSTIRFNRNTVQEQIEGGIKDKATGEGFIKSETAKLEKLKRDLKQASTPQPAYTPSPCKGCGRPFDEVPEGKIDSARVAHLETSIKEVEEGIKEMSDTLAEHAIELEKLYQQRAEIDKDLEQDKELRDTYKELRSAVEEVSRQRGKLISDMTEIDAKIQAKKSSTNPYTHTVSEVEQGILSASAELDVFESDLSTLRDDLRYLEFWDKGFGNQGIKSFVLDGVVPILNEKANKYSKILTDGAIHIKFSTQTRIKSGELRDKFEVSAFNNDGSEVYKGNSGGERRRIDLAVMFALQALVQLRSRNSLNILFMDEVFDTLDSAGCDRVIQLLQDEMKDKSSVFVITHNPDLRSQFDQVITVIKEKGISRVEE